ncbi:MAG: hypothetical protein JOZ24_01720 [Candidatus Eremiobacteraeota bacterium]|nr:hypothetical protein [Candidatus Eremiobacteraeota bacterium]
MLAALSIAGAVMLSGAAASAHPLGNFTVNHLSRVTATPRAVEVRYVLDMAEIPTFALDRSLDPRGRPSRQALARWGVRHVGEIAPLPALRVDGASVRLAPRAAPAVTLRPGAGGLPTLYLRADFAAPLARGAHHLDYADRTEPGRLGWKDVVVGARAEPTDELRTYPSALVGSPRSRTTLAARRDAGGAIVDLGAPTLPVIDAAPPGGVARANALADALARGASNPLVVLAALVLAVVLGALHALEPGHGKTLLAVSLVGARATVRQALILAGALTVAHTAGVLALGLAVLAAAAWIVPEQIYPWVTLGSGIVVAFLGARAVAREVRRRLPHAHVHLHQHAGAHPHAHGHVHGGRAHHHHDLGDPEHARAHALGGDAPLTFTGAILAAASGNVAPCPAAFVVLLTAIQLHRVGYGLALIVAFGIGLATTLTVLGIAVVRSAAWLGARPRFAAATRWAPALTAVVIATLGAVMIGQGFAASGSGVPVAVTAMLVLFAIAGYAVAWHAPRSPSQAHA